MKKPINVEKFNSLYNKVFDENDQVKPCGRDACIRLLICIGDPSYGNEDTGTMEVDKIVALHKGLNKGE